MTQREITSICNALMDILIEVEDSDIEFLGLKKGIMHLVDSARQRYVLDYFKNRAKVTELGGSALNAVRTLANLGHNTFFAGMISDDDYGNQIKSRLDKLGIGSNLGGHAHESTGTCIILITPDGERTMNTNLGASRLYTKALVPTKELESSKLFHFCGYQWDTDEQKAALNSAISTCSKHETLISFDLADPFVVDRNRADFLRMIDDHADIVFANKEEARLLLNTEPMEAAKRIAAHGAVAVVKLGGEGAIVCKGNDVHHIKPVQTSVIDTTAAGDMFAAGFLHGFLKGRDLPTCGSIASVLASDVISRVGATVSEKALSKAKTM